MSNNNPVYVSKPRLSSRVPQHHTYDLEITVIDDVNPPYTLTPQFTYPKTLNTTVSDPNYGLIEPNDSMTSGNGTYAKSTETDINILAEDC